MSLVKTTNPGNIAMKTLQVAASTKFLLLTLLHTFACIMMLWAPVQAQTAVAVGSGSYASAVPTNQYGLDEYYGLGIDQIISYYSMLHLDPSKQGAPIPTNHWWTDALIGDR